jgi:hypothetical protein
MIHSARLIKLERQIENRATELRELEEEIERARRETGNGAGLDREGC